MKNNDLNEGNKIIAIFNGDYSDTGLEPSYYVNFNKEYKIEDSRYHLEWNWIMPVYIRIVRLMYEYEEMSEDCVILFNVLYDRVGDGDGVLEVWEQVVEWIKAYNKSQEDSQDGDIDDKVIEWIKYNKLQEEDGTERG